MISPEKSTAGKVMKTNIIGIGIFLTIAENISGVMKVFVLRKFIFWLLPLSRYQNNF